MATVFRWIERMALRLRLFPADEWLGMRLFLSVTALLWVFVGCFVYYQGQREREFKIKLLTTQLLQLNEEMAIMAGRGDSLLRGTIETSEKNSHLRNLRVTVLDTLGHVLNDNMTSRAHKLPNHIQRPEIQQALREGTGFIVRRNSETMGEDYFYVASSFPSLGLVVRTALPYNVQLVHSLSADRGFIWFSVCVALVLTLVFYRQTRLLDQMVRRVQEQENARLKRQLTLNMSHELKTPVASIQGYVETILQNPDLDEAHLRQFLQRCHVQTLRLTNILRDINTLNRIDEAPEQMPCAFLDLRPLIEGVFRESQLAASQREMTLSLDLPPEIPLSGNEGLLYSVFRNLLDNSIAYAGIGTHVSLQCQGPSDGCWHFTFRDDGVGVPDAHLPHLFERFYRVDKGRSRRIGGTGLGLAIVKNAVLFHHGVIMARQVPTGGLEFVFTLRAME
ncbi:MAG: sensor histidine kinase [Bacteroidaceae bacterium]